MEPLRVWQENRRKPAIGQRVDFPHVFSLALSFDYSNFVTHSNLRDEQAPHR